MRTETIYIACAADNEFDSRLSTYFSHNPGFAADNKRELLRALSTAAGRNDIIFIVGGMAGDSVDCTAILAGALGIEREGVSSERSRKDAGNVFLPAGAVPLYSFSGTLSGNMLASGAQMLVHLTEHPVRRLDALLQVLDIVRSAAPAYFEKDKTMSQAQPEQAQPEQAQPEQAQPEQAQPVIQVGEPGVPEVSQLSVPAFKIEELLSAEPIAEQVAEPITEPDKPLAVSDTEVSSAPAEAEMSEPAEETSFGDDFYTEPPDFEEILRDSEPDEKSPRLFRAVIYALVICLLAGSVFSGGILANKYLFSGNRAEKIYSDIRGMIGGSYTIELPVGMQPKFGALYEMNRDLCGWVEVEHTALDYPVVFNPNKDYSEVLFDGSKNIYGTPHIKQDAQNPSNIIVTGTARDGLVFGTLKNYLQQDYFAGHERIFYSDTVNDYEYVVFAVLETESSSAGMYAGDDLYNDAVMNGHIEQLMRDRLYDTGVEAAASDSLLMLVAKAEDKSTIVAARRLRDDEASTKKADPIDFRMDYIIDAVLPVVANPASSMGSSLLAPALSESPAAQASRAASRAASAASKNAASGAASGVASSVASQTAPSTAAASSKAPEVSKPQWSSLGEALSLGYIVIDNVYSGTVREEGTIFDIVARNVECEMGYRYHDEALKAQAVAAFSFMKYHMERNSVPALPMLDMSKVSDKVKACVSAVLNQYVTHGGKTAQTTFFDTAAGKTANAIDVWGGTGYPYLVPVDSPLDEKNTFADFRYKTTREYKAEDMRRWIAEQYPDARLPEDKTKWFSFTYDSNGVYTKTAVIGGKTVRGIDIRYNLLTAARVGSANVLRSHAFTLTYDRAGDKFVFNCTGYGHGVGMSQSGANEMAKTGKSYSAILSHYYTGTTLVKP